MKATIYVLCHPITSEVRYVGKTVKSLESRFAMHVNSAFNRGSKTHLARWMRSLGVLPEVRALMVVNGDGCQAEQGIIALYRAKGYRLTNITAGGEGVVGRVCSPEQRKKISDSNRGRVFTEDHRAKMSASRKGVKRKPHTAEACAKISAAMQGNTRALGFKHSAESRQNMSAAMKGHKRALGRVLSPETRAKIGNSNRGKIRTEETKAKLSAAKIGKKRAPFSLETRTKLSKALKGKRKNNQHWLGRKHTPAALAKMSAAHRGRKPSTETKAKMRESRLTYLKEHRTNQ